MTDKQINKWLRRRFSRVGWTLIAYFLLMNVLAGLCMGLDALKQMLWSAAAGDFSGSLDYDALAGNAWGYILTIAVGFAIFHAGKDSAYWRQEAFQKRNPMTLGSWLCLLCLCVGAQMVNSLWVTGLEVGMNAFDKSIIPILESVSGDSDTFSMFLYASILAPIAEEFLFRGYVLRFLRPYGKRFAIFGSAVLFGLFHGNLLQTPYAILMGLILGYVTVEYSIFWSIGLHMFNNLILADLLTRLTASWTDFAYNLLNLALFGGSFLISLVILFRNRKQIRDYRKSEWMDRRCIKCFLLNSGVLVLTAISIWSMASLFWM